ncbi:type II toxin-antitoxin system RelE/ParE family toxin [Pseudomonas sp. SAS7]|jgi:mRNA-degrading endonuclease RelE of RelBE toxin-antitoxin system|uniref:type II toxin-antitoxin system RelE family toxin n=1 Tax=Pseudomonas TaxID=286 RepID=UPI0021646E3B|nr:type II toxin-antitoxin system RelE/ParE family toxin [Pseudomonas putida]
MNTINWSRKAVKQLRKIDKVDQPKVYDAAQALARMPHVQSVKALANHNYGYRLRVGNYRILFDWDGSVKIVNIEEVKKRDEHTY